MKTVTNKQLWTRYLKPLGKLREKIKEDQTDHELAAALKPLEEISLKLWRMRDARQLAEAERKDKGVILWEVFHPRTKTPLNISFFDMQRRVTRTPNRVFIENEYSTIKGEWKLESSDPWVHLDRELHREPFDLEKFRQYGRDVEEALRRHCRRRDFLVTDDTGRVHEVRCETADEASKKVERIFGGDPSAVKSVEEVW